MNVNTSNLVTKLTKLNCFGGLTKFLKPQFPIHKIYINLKRHRVKVLPSQHLQTLSFLSHLIQVHFLLSFFPSKQFPEKKAFVKNIFFSNHTMWYIKCIYQFLEIKYSKYYCLSIDAQHEEEDNQNGCLSSYIIYFLPH